MIKWKKINIGSANKQNTTHTVIGICNLHVLQLYLTSIYVTAHITHTAPHCSLSLIPWKHYEVYKYPTRLSAMNSTCITKHGCIKYKHWQIQTQPCKHTHYIYTRTLTHSFTHSLHRNNSKHASIFIGHSNSSEPAPQTKKRSMGGWKHGLYETNIN